MNENKYLTRELKNYYMSDFAILLSFKGSDFWDIDEGLEELLIQINKNIDFQTLYSKKFEIKPDSFSIECDSYLDLAYSKKAQEHLLSLLNDVIISSNCNNSQIWIENHPPCDNANYRKESNFDIGCIKNPDYFRINHIRIKIESANIECHNLFWQNMESKFTELK